MIIHKLKNVSCNTCSFFTRHFFAIILTTLIVSAVFLGISILLSTNEIYLGKTFNSNFLTHKNDIIKSPTSNVLQDTDAIKLPIIMYHALIEDPTKQNTYFISPNIFENDLKYLAKQGFNTVTMSELIGFVYEGKPLPEKPIILTFDDGYFNNYFYAYPLLKKYNQKAVISIIGNQTDLFSLLKEYNTYYSHTTWSQLNEMVLSGHVEVQNHSYDLHSIKTERKGCVELKMEPFAQYKEVLVSDVGLLQEKIQMHTGFVPNTFTYPFGKYSDFSERVIKEMGFKASLTCAEKINYIEKNPDSLYKLGRFLRSPNEKSEDFFNRILNK